jgi:hypothetical protein
MHTHTHTHTRTVLREGRADGADHDGIHSQVAQQHIKVHRIAAVAAVGVARSGEPVEAIHNRHIICHLRVIASHGFNGDVYLVQEHLVPEVHLFAVESTTTETLALLRKHL